MNGFAAEGLEGTLKEESWRSSPLRGNQGPDMPEKPTGVRGECGKEVPEGIALFSAFLTVNFSQRRVPSRHRVGKKAPRS